MTLLPMPIRISEFGDVDMSEYDTVFFRISPSFMVLIYLQYSCAVTPSPNRVRYRSEVRSAASEEHEDDTKLKGERTCVGQCDDGIGGFRREH